MKTVISSKFKSNFGYLFWFYLLFLVARATYFSVKQYQVWHANDFTRLLLEQPGYYSRYAFGRFWLNLLIALAFALVFYLLIRGLRYYQPRWFAQGDAELALLTAFFSGWPGVLIFAILLALFAIILALYRQLVLKQAHTALAWPMILASFVAYFFGTEIIVWLGWSVLFV